MIDFRYHLVSLVSVFLALAVGIVLGAGPLKGAIGDTLSSQVHQLRAEKATLRTELDTAHGAVDNRDAFTQAVLPTLVRSRLGGQAVLVVTLPGADTDAVKPLTESLQVAGARVTGRIDIKDAWTDPQRTTERETALRSLSVSTAATGVTVVTGRATASATAGTAAVPTAAVATAAVATAAVATALPTAAATSPVPSVSGATTASAALATVLAQAVVTRELGPTGPLDAGGKALLDGLRKAGLIGIGSDVTGRATEVVVLAPGVEQAPEGQPDTPTSVLGDRLAQWSAIAVGLDARSGGVVVLGPASSATAGGVLETLRGQEALAGTVSTVDSGGTPMGNVAAVLALREQSSGGAGNYGFVGKAKAPLPALTEVGT
jgi:hypothetical protein